MKIYTTMVNNELIRPIPVKKLNILVRFEPLSLKRKKNTSQSHGNFKVTKMCKAIFISVKKSYMIKCVFHYIIKTRNNFQFLK
jgi:hypothetical protein